ncbi:MAG: 4-hydroxy-tetrahydrodipicolinate reductase [Rickettsiales bacterium]|nr:4-hydroxy-tetrahydrodipicolinate reductase [Rickettsiales bacterium]
MDKIKLAITGYTGKMGQSVLSEVVNFPSFNLAYALVEEKNKKTPSTIELITNIDKFCSVSDIIIDFSVAEIFHKLLNAAIKYKTPLVSGTTSLKEEDFKTLQKASKAIPILYSQNMSIGITVLSSIVRDLYLKLANKSDIEIIETHHRNKKDIPSGTAIMLASKMVNKKDITANCINRTLFKDSKEDRSEKIGISSVRGGTVAGQHDVLFMMENENIKISHQALNRNIFAIGALKAANWLYKQPAGLYSMEDFIKY